MSRVWFEQPLETVATFWRILRRDGVTLGFTSHDRDLWFDGVLHRAAPGMVPSAVRRSAGLDPDSVEVAGVLAHDAIAPADLAAGRFDGARARIGLVDWQTLERQTVFVGTIHATAQEDGTFTAELASRKAELTRPAVVRTSPSCRAAFCGPGCDLDPVRFTHEAQVIGIDREASRVRLDLADPAGCRGGMLRWLDGPCAGQRHRLLTLEQGWFVLDGTLPASLAAGVRALVREGCDHALGTCADRFGNAANFRGEPFLPGNDLLARYPSAFG